MRKILRNKRGQSATEYMLIIAVVVLGLVAAASRFIPKFNDAISELAKNVTTWIEKDQKMASPDG